MDHRNTLGAPRLLHSLLALAAAMALSACGPAPEAEQEAAEREARLRMVEQQVEDLQRQIIRLTAQAGTNAMRLDIEALQSQAASLAGRLAALESQPRTAAEIAEAPAPAAAGAAPSPAPSSATNRYQNKPPAISIYNSADSRLADFIETPPAGQTDLFPIRVTNILARRIVINSHPSVRVVETDTEYKDEFGLVQKERKEVQEIANEYAYEVMLTLENLTRTEKSVTVSAGGGSQTVPLRAGEQRNELTLRSTLGADLNVQAGGQLRRFPLRFEDRPFPAKKP